MKRLVYDVSRWHIYLHRNARRMPLVDKYDDRVRAFSDEVFARLYSGLVEVLPEPGSSHVDRKSWEWAMQMHTQCTLLPELDFAQLSNHCRGHIDRAAHVTEELLKAIGHEDTARGNKTNSGSSQASSASNTARDAADGLNQVQAPSMGAWAGRWQGDATENERAKNIAERLKDNERLKRIAMLAGRFKRVALSRQKTVVRRGTDEIADVAQGSDVSRLLPFELVRLVSPKHRLLALRDLMEHRCLQYQMTSTETLGRGPLVLCQDKSSSMEGDKDVWSSAVSLALLDIAHRQRRDFILLGFNHDIPQRVVVRRGNPIPEKELLSPCSGGTDIFKVLDLALNAVETRKIMHRADIVLVTDGESSLQFAPWIRARAIKTGVGIVGVGIDVDESGLTPWCDEAHCITNVNEIDDRTSDLLFAR